MSAPTWDTEWAAKKAADALRWLAENYPECAGSEELHPTRTPPTRPPSPGTGKHTRRLCGST